MNFSHLDATMALLAYENFVRFSRYFYETIVIWKFPSREIGEKIRKLNPVNCNFASSHRLAKLNAAPHGHCCPAHPAQQHA